MIERGSIPLKFCFLLVVLSLGAWVSFGITRTAKGTCNNTKTTCTISSVTLSTGDALVVGTVHGASSITSVVWNSQSLSQDCYANSGTDTAIYSKGNLTGATSDVVITFSGNTSSGGFATAISDLSTAPFDVQAGATGSGTEPSSGATGTTSQADEIAIAAVGLADATIGGTWLNSFTGGQQGGNANRQVEEGYLILSATQTVTGAKTGTTSASWAACVATYKASGGAPPPTPRRLTLLGVGALLRPWPLHSWLLAEPLAKPLAKPLTKPLKRFYAPAH